MLHMRERDQVFQYCPDVFVSIWLKENHSQFSECSQIDLLGCPLDRLTKRMLGE